MKILEVWVNSGCIHVKDSPLSTLHVRQTDQRKFTLQDSSCQDSPQLCMRGCVCCQKCLQAANRKKALFQVQEWAQRICFVDLLHTTLKGNCKEQEEYATFMKDLFVDLQEEDLAHMSYSNLVSRCRLQFMRIPSCKQSVSLEHFISRTLRYLSPQMLVGVPSEIKQQVQCYVDSLQQGVLLPQESKAIQIISQGGMRADDLARALVPTLLAKADKVNRGCKRTGSIPESLSGITDLGFMLGGALQSPELQRAFGLSRQAAKSALPPMRTPFLPHFFVAEGTILEENFRTAVGLLHHEDRPDRKFFMLARDEVVYSKSFNIIYGMGSLDAPARFIFG